MGTSLDSTAVKSLEKMDAPDQSAIQDLEDSIEFELRVLNLIKDLQPKDVLYEEWPLILKSLQIIGATYGNFYAFFPEEFLPCKIDELRKILKRNIYISIMDWELSEKSHDESKLISEALGLLFLMTSSAISLDTALFIFKYCEDIKEGLSPNKDKQGYYKRIVQITNEVEDQLGKEFDGIIKSALRDYKKSK